MEKLRRAQDHVICLSIPAPSIHTPNTLFAPLAVGRENTYLVGFWPSCSLAACLSKILCAIGCKVIVTGLPVLAWIMRVVITPLLMSFHSSFFTSTHRRPV